MTLMKSAIHYDVSDITLVHKSLVVQLILSTCISLTVKMIYETNCDSELCISLPEERVMTLRKNSLLLSIKQNVDGQYPRLL